jgi:hypothetical protein
MTSLRKPDAAGRIESLVQGAFEAFARAAGRDSEHRESRFRIGGLSCRLLTAGRGLHPFFSRAFGHLAQDGEGAQVTIRIWDGRSTGIPMPAPVWQAGDTISQGYLPSLSNETTSVFFDPDTRDFLLVDGPSGNAFRRIGDATCLPDHEHAAPLRLALQYLFRGFGLTVCHAAAIGRGERGLLVAGPGGHGKSTTALAALAAGWTFIGDDYVAIRADPPVAYSLYGSAKLDPGFAPRLRGLENLFRHGQPLAGGKVLVWPNESEGAMIAPSFEIAAIVLPRVSGEAEPRVEQGNMAEALRALAPSSLFQSIRPLPDDFRALVALLKTIPVYRLFLGEKPERIPRVLAPLV